MADDKIMNLDDKVSLSGFGSEDGSTMVIVKKMLGNHVKKISDSADNFQSMHVTLKKIHQHEGKGGKSDIHVKIMAAGKAITAEAIDFNLLTGLDAVFKKIDAELSRD